jgi:hypothetical protein
MLGVTCYNALAAVGLDEESDADLRVRCRAALGMLYALEVVASVYGGPFSAAIRESLLLDGDAGVSFISSHTTMDSEHIADLRKIVNQVDDEAAMDAMVESAEMNFHHFGRLFATLP